MATLKKDVILNALKEKGVRGGTKDVLGIKCEDLKTLISSDNRGIMQTLSYLKRGGHNIQVKDGYVKLMPDESKPAVSKRYGIGEDMLSAIMKKPQSAAELCKMFKITQAKVFSTVHRIRQEHDIQTKDGKYVYIKGSPSVKISKELVDNDIVLGRITRKDIKKIPQNLMADFTDTLRKMVFYYDMVRSFIEASQKVDKFMGSNLAE